MILDLFRDQLWQFIGVIVAILGIGVSIILYQHQRSKKSLSYSVISRTSLLSVNNAIKGDMQIRYKDKRIEQIHLILLKIINSGNIPITRGDVERQISIDFGSGAHVISSEIVETEPEGLCPSTIIQENKVNLEPVLMNGGDFITLKMIVDGFNGNIELDGRVVGVKEIKALGEQSVMGQLLGGLITLIGVVLISVGVGMEAGLVTFLLGAASSLMLMGTLINTISQLRRRKEVRES